jgi:hypothetical protein
MAAGMPLPEHLRPRCHARSKDEIIVATTALHASSPDSSFGSTYRLISRASWNRADLFFLYDLRSASTSGRPGLTGGLPKSHVVGIPQAQAHHPQKIVGQLGDCGAAHRNRWLISSKNRPSGARWQCRLSGSTGSSHLSRQPHHRARLPKSMYLIDPHCLQDGAKQLSPPLTEQD